MFLEPFGFSAARWPALGLFRLRGGGNVVLSGCAEELVEEREGRGLAVVLVGLIVIALVLAEQSLQPVHGFGHFAVEVFQIILRQAHPLDHIVDGLCPFLRALEAQALG